MAREKRKPKKDKQKDEPQLKEEVELVENGEEGALPDDEEEPKPFVAYFEAVPAEAMSPQAKEETDALITRLQAGESLSLPQSRPMPSIGRRCHELRIQEEDGIWRVFYRVDPDAIRAVHVLWKTTQKTPQSSIELSKKRFSQVDQVLKLAAAQRQRREKNL